MKNHPPLHLADGSFFGANEITAISKTIHAVAYNFQLSFNRKRFPHKPATK